MRQCPATIAFVTTTLCVAPLCAASFDLGDLPLAGTQAFLRSFDARYMGGFTDHYTFSLMSPGGVSGSVLDVDGYLKLGPVFKIKDLDAKSLSLAQRDSDGRYAVLFSDTSPVSFSFNALSAGDYRLTVKGAVVPTVRHTPGEAANGGVSRYALMASAVPAIAPVSDISSLMLVVVGLAGVGIWTRRQLA